MQITITQTTVPDYQGVGSTATLRIYADKSFLTSDGDRINKSKVGGAVWYKDVACTVGGRVLTIPTFTIDSTTDSNVPTAKYSAAILDANGAISDPDFFKHFYVPHDLGSPLTFAMLFSVNQETVAHRPGQTYTQEQINTIVANAIAGFVKATESTYGQIRLSLPAVSTSVPVVVGDNDPRVNKVNVAQYASFSAAVDAVAAFTGTNILQVTTAVTTGAKTIPSDVILDFDTNGVLNITGAVVIQGEIRAPAQQIFNITTGSLNITSAKAEVFYLEWYGASTSASDNSTVIQALVTARKTVPTVIRLRGSYQCATTISFDDTQSMSLIGDGGSYNSITTELKYTGSGTGGFTFRHSVGFTAYGVKFSYNNASFTGTLVKSSGAGGADTTGFVFDRCFFTGTGSGQNAAALLSLGYCIVGKVTNSTFLSAVLGIRGRTVPEYSNVITVENCTFMDVGAHIFNPGEDWIVQGCTHEQIVTTRGSYKIGQVRAIEQDSTSWNLLYQGNWIGDGAASPDDYACITLFAAYGVAILGNKVSLPNEGTGGVATAITLKGCDGVAILGNYFAADRLMTYETANSNNVFVAGNKTSDCLVVTPASIGGFYGVAETFINATGNTMGSPLKFSGIAYAVADPTDAHALTVGVANAAIDLNNGSAIRTTNNISGIPEGSLVYQSRTKSGQTAGWHIFQTLTQIAMTIKDTLVSFGVPIVFATDNTYDIGAAGATRPRTIYAGTSMITADDPYDATNWNGSNVVPTKNAVRDEMELRAKLAGAAFTGAVSSTAAITSSGGGITSSGGGIGYTAGAGGTVAQATSKATAVILNKLSGQITLNAAALAANTVVSFTFTNSFLAAGDRIIFSHDSGGTLGAYYFTHGLCGAGSVTIYVRNLTAGSLSEAAVIGFSVLKSSNT